MVFSLFKQKRNIKLLLAKTKASYSNYWSYMYYLHLILTLKDDYVIVGYWSFRSEGIPSDCLCSECTLPDQIPEIVKS